MSAVINKIQIIQTQEGGFGLIIPPALKNDFKLLVLRAMNTWQDAPLELREFSDLLIHGMVLQDYTKYAIPVRGEAVQEEQATAFDSFNLLNDVHPQ